jgi:ATP-dependent Clp protease ATP-binding subunit ClpB
MTSNLGAQDIVALAGAGQEALDEKMAEALKQHFAPEFVNRIDDIVVFNRLRREDMGTIVAIQLRRTNGLLSERGLQIELSDGAVEFLGNKGWDPAFGARPLKRAIQKYLMDPLSVKILKGEVNPPCLVRVDVEGGELLFES